MKLTATNVTDRLGNEFFRLLMEREDGVVVKRTVTIPTFCQMLGHSMKNELLFQEYDKEFFPENTLYAKSADKLNFDCVWRESPGKKVVVYYDQHFIVPFPDLVFGVSVRGGVAQGKYCFAIKKGGNKLYNYPFGNVSMGGAICMGNIQYNLDSHVADFSEDFYLGETNDDYYRSDKVSAKYSQRQLLEKLTKKETFPEKWLVETSSYDLDSFIQHFKGKN